MKELYRLAAEFEEEEEEPMPTTLRSGETPPLRERPVDIKEVAPMSSSMFPSKMEEPPPPSSPERKQYLRSTLAWMLKSNMITSIYYEKMMDHLKTETDTTALEKELQDVIQQSELDLIDFLKAFHNIKHLMRVMRGLPQ